MELNFALLCTWNKYIITFVNAVASMILGYAQICFRNVSFSVFSILFFQPYYIKLHSKCNFECWSSY